jgi:hypothetical protein
MYYAAALKDPTVVAHLSKQQQQTQTQHNKSTTTNTVHPYSSVSLSPLRNYAIAACKSDIQILRVDPTGLHHLKTVSCNPYFVVAAAHKKKQQNHMAATTTTKNNGTSWYEESLNLREFAFGGIGGPNQQHPPPPPSSSASASASMMNVVITDVAWSPWSTPVVSEDTTTTNGSSDGILGDTHHHSFPSTTNIHQNNNSNNSSTNIQNHGLIAAAGSNGTIVVWNASALLSMIPQTTSSSSGQHQHNNHPMHAPEAVLSLHVRAVNRLAWHPQRAMLLSASQDGTVLLWERKQQQPQQIRSKKDMVDSRREKYEASLGKFRGLFGHMGASAPSQPQQSYEWFCRATFAPKSEAVRDICWSPFYEDGKLDFQSKTTLGKYIRWTVENLTHINTKSFASFYIVVSQNQISICSCDNQWVVDHLQSECLRSRIGENECPFGGCHNLRFPSDKTKHNRHRWIERSIGKSMGSGIGFDVWSKR